MPTYVQQKWMDLLPIPDKYNTGCDESLITTTVSEAGTYNGIVYGTVGSRRSLEFQYSANQNLGATLLIENTMFPNGLQDLNNGVLARTITFKNCYFMGRFSVPTGNNNVFIYEDCTFEYCSPSFSTFYRCKFYRSSGAGDGMNPYKNVIAYNCYFYDLIHLTTSINAHCDGVQIFGHDSLVDSENIHFYNCRYEMPWFPIEGQASGSYANAQIMIALEDSNGVDISFENCHINGGGYSMYALANPPHTLTDILLKDIKIGQAHRYGDLYQPQNLDPNVTLENITDTTQLIIGDVWKDENNHVHMSVSNDTLSVKNLVVYTNLGFQFFQIPACFSSAVIMAEPITTYYSYSDYPFDIDKDCGVVDYVVAFDGNVTEENQVRFVNFTEIPVEFPDISNSIKATVSELLLRRRQLLVKHTAQPIYTPLEYLQSTGTQYLELPFKPNGLTTKIEVIAGVVQGGTQYLYGTQNTSSTVMFMDRVNATDKSVRSAYGNQLTTSYANATYFDYNDVYKSVRDKNVISYYDLSDNLIHTETLTLSDFTPTNNLIIFGNNIAGTITKSYNRNYGTRIWTNDVLVYDFIPVLDGSNVPCMYDKVSKTFFYNQGTGTFLYA